MVLNIFTLLDVEKIVRLLEESDAKTEVSEWEPRKH